MPRLQVAHTGLLDGETLTTMRAFLAEVFVGEFTNHDWENALGGVHALLWEEGDLIGHGSVVQRRLLHRGLALRAGFMECVGVRADRRRRGHGTEVMGALETVTRQAYDLGALRSTDMAKPFYGVLGWKPWEGPLAMLTPEGVRDDPRHRERIYVLEQHLPLDPEGTLTCDWREGDPW